MNRNLLAASLAAPLFGACLILSPPNLASAPSPLGRSISSGTAVQKACSTTDGSSRVVRVNGESELREAIARALPGDFIQLAPGTYQGEFRATRSGTPDSPIKLCGTHAALLQGNSTSRGYGFYLSGNHWVLGGFTITGSQFGLYLVGASNNVLDGLRIHHIGQEGVRFRSFSSNNTLQNSEITDTGLLDAEYGEGIYVGSYRGQWGNYSEGRPDASNNNNLLNNQIGPNVRAEGIDVKEGTSGGRIEGNVFRSAGMVRSKSWVDSVLELKGNNYTIRGNRVLGTVRDAFQVFEEISGWGQGNIFSDNQFDLRGASGHAIRIDSGGNTVRCNNTVQGAGQGLSNIRCQN